MITLVGGQASEDERGDTQRPQQPKRLAMWLHGSALAPGKQRISRFCHGLERLRVAAVFGALYDCTLFESVKDGLTASGEWHAKCCGVQSEFKAFFAADGHSAPLFGLDLFNQHIDSQPCDAKARCDLNLEHAIGA